MDTTSKFIHFRIYIPQNPGSCLLNGKIMRLIPEYSIYNGQIPKESIRNIMTILARMDYR